MFSKIFKASIRLFLGYISLPTFFVLLETKLLHSHLESKTKELIERVLFFFAKYFNGPVVCLDDMSKIKAAIKDRPIFYHGWLLNKEPIDEIELKIEVNGQVFYGEVYPRKDLDHLNSFRGDKVQGDGFFVKFNVKENINLVTFSVSSGCRDHWVSRSVIIGNVPKEN